MKKRYKKGIVILTIVVLLAGSYFYLSGSGGDAQQDAALNVVSQPAGDAAGSSVVDNQRTLELLNDLRSISLSTELFNSPAFQSLQSFDVTLNSQPMGRGNPFAPIGVESEPVASEIFLSERPNASTSTPSAATTTNATTTDPDTSGGSE